MTAGRLVVVGGSVAATALVDELRRLGDDRPVVILEAQDHLPYDRPPLSKGVLTGSVDPDTLAFHDADHYARTGVEVRTSARATGLDPAGPAVRLADGRTVAGDAVVVATGAVPRRLPGEPAGLVHVVRDRAQAEALRTALASARRVAVLGGGFIGAEVASSAVETGLEVTLVEAEPVPLGRRLGTRVAELLVERHRRAGIRVECGRPVESVAAAGSGATVRLADGTGLTADVVVAGLGVLPEVGWLDGSGLRLAAGGVECDETGRTAVPGVYALGDAAGWFDARAGVHTRHEHWTSAREQAVVLAGLLAGTPAPRWADAVPYVWSDQHGARIQILGSPAASDTVHVEPDGDRFLALYERDGVLTGAVGCRAAARLGRLRQLLATDTPIEEAVRAAAGPPARRPVADGAPR